jgi:hypothetical protein
VLAARLLADQGRNVAEYLAVLRYGTGASARGGKLCVMDLRLDHSVSNFGDISLIMKNDRLKTGMLSQHRVHC